MHTSNFNSLSLSRSLFTQTITQGHKLEPWYTTHDTQPGSKLTHPTNIKLFQRLTLPSTSCLGGNIRQEWIVNEVFWRAWRWFGAEVLRQGGRYEGEKVKTGIWTTETPASEEEYLSLPVACLREVIRCWVRNYSVSARWILTMWISALVAWIARGFSIYILSF